MPATDSVLISVIVPCRNEVGHITQLLDALDAQVDVPGPWEVIAADGMSTDGTWEALEERAQREDRLHLICNQARFVSPGLNLAIAAARGTYIIRMDAHTDYAENYIAECVGVLRETNADNVGGAARTVAHSPAQRAIAAAYSSRFGVGPANFHFADYEGPADTVTYGCWLKTTLERLGGFDENLVRNQDDELNLRIRLAGGMVWQSRRIVSWYSPRSSLATLYRQYFQYGYWKVAVLKKHRIAASWRHLVPGGFVLFVILNALAGIFWHPARYVAGGALAAYALFLFVGSLVIAKRKGWDLLPRLPQTLATFHLSYGLGFIAALTGLGSASRFSGLSR